MRKILLLFIFAALSSLMLAVLVSAAATNEFGVTETLESIDLRNMNEDTVARVVIVDSSGEYHTYPASYILIKGTTLGFDFKPISTALGENISKGNVVRIEVPSNIETITYGGMASFSNLVEIKFFDDSCLQTVAGGGFYNNPLLEKINLPASLKEFTGTQIFNMCYALHTVTFAENSQLEKIPDLCFQNCTSLKKLVLPHSVTTLGNKLFDSKTAIEELYLSPNLVDFGSEHFAWKQSGVLKIFAPAQLFESKESIGIRDFSWWENDGCLPSMVIFMTGTEAQAQAIVAKTEYHKLLNAVVSEWDASKTTDDYAPELGWAIVYGYGVCDAFYKGEHSLTGVDSAKVTDYFSEIPVGDICTRVGCGIGVIKKVIAPLFSDLGVSFSQVPDASGKYGVVRGYTVNYQACEELSEYQTVEYGLVISSAAVENVLWVEGGSVVAGDRVFHQKDIPPTYDCVELKVSGFDASASGMELILAMYVFDGEKITYLSSNTVLNFE